MQLPGPGVWGEPQDPDEAVRVLRRPVDLGVNLIDTGASEIELSDSDDAEIDAAAA